MQKHKIKSINAELRRGASSGTIAEDAEGKAVQISMSKVGTMFFLHSVCLLRLSAGRAAYQRAASAALCVKALVFLTRDCRVVTPWRDSSQ